MRQLVLLYWGTVFLMYLSQTYYPVETQLDGRQTGKRHFMLRRSDLFIILVVVWMTNFAFLRTGYNDTYTYRVFFEEAQSLADGFANGTFTDWFGNPLSMLYRSLTREMTDNYHIYFFFPAFMSSFAVIKLCKRYSVNPAFSLLIFYSVGVYLMYMAALKQCMAVFFVIIAIPYALDKKYVRFYLWLLVACLFHTHAFMFAIVPFLTRKPWGKLTWALLITVLFAMATYDTTLGAFLNYAASIGFDINENEVFDGHSINVLRVMVYWVPGLLALVFRKRLFQDSTKEENLFVNMSIMSAMILMLGLVEGANMFARMTGYFIIGTIVALPWMIKKLFTKQSAQLVTVCATLLYFGYFWYENTFNLDFGSEYNAISLWQFITSLFGG